LGLLFMPWKLLATLGRLLFTWLGGYAPCWAPLRNPARGLLFGAKGELKVDDLYRRNGGYEYSGGWNIHALIAFALGVLPLATWWCPACWTVPPWLHPWSACLTLAGSSAWSSRGLLPDHRQTHLIFSLKWSTIMSTLLIRSGTVIATRHQTQVTSLWTAKSRPWAGA
jgi:hypothetical protein